MSRCTADLFNLLSTWTSRPFSEKLLSNQLVPSLHCWERGTVAFAFIELHKVPVSPFLQPVEVPLNGSPILQHISCSLQFEDWRLAGWPVDPWFLFLVLFSDGYKICLFPVCILFASWSNLRTYDMDYFWMKPEVVLQECTECTPVANGSSVHRTTIKLFQIKTSKMHSVASPGPQYQIFPKQLVSHYLLILIC